MVCLVFFCCLHTILLWCPSTWVHTCRKIKCHTNCFEIRKPCFYGECAIASYAIFSRACYWFYTTSQCNEWWWWISLEGCRKFHLNKWFNLKFDCSYYIYANVQLFVVFIKIQNVCLQCWQHDGVGSTQGFCVLVVSCRLYFDRVFYCSSGDHWIVCVFCTHHHCCLMGYLLMFLHSSSLWPPRCFLFPFHFCPSYGCRLHVGFPLVWGCHLLIVLHHLCGCHFCGTICHVSECCLIPTPPPICAYHFRSVLCHGCRHHFLSVLRGGCPCLFVLVFFFQIPYYYLLPILCHWQFLTTIIFSTHVYKTHLP